jgi:hypothetical protein
MSCEICKDKGWIIATRADGRKAVERCDDCKTFETDTVAAQVSGQQCEPEYPCVLT